MKKWNDLSWPEVAGAVAETPWALLSFGAVEEHGPHLPLGTDTFAAEELSVLIAKAADLIELPVMPFGQVWSLEHFDGSLSVSLETLVALITDLSNGLERVGVKGLVLFTAHLGNSAALKQASRVLEETRGLPALALSYPGLSTIASEVRESLQSHPAIMHADEIETSILLALREEAVQMNRAVCEYPNYPKYFDTAAVRWDTVNDSGVFGDATLATAEKGVRIVDHVVATSAAIIADWKDSLS